MNPDCTDFFCNLLSLHLYGGGFNKKLNYWRLVCVFTAYGPGKVRVDLHRTSGSSDCTRTHSYLNDLDERPTASFPLCFTSSSQMWRCTLPAGKQRSNSGERFRISNFDASALEMEHSSGI